MKRPGHRHLAVVRAGERAQLQDSSPELAEALENVAMNQYRYTNCECGVLVRCQKLEQSLEAKQLKLIAWGGLCPHCKTVLQINQMPPQKVVQLATPAEVPPGVPT